MNRDIFRYQIWHLLSVAALAFLTRWIVTLSKADLSGSFIGMSSHGWFWLAAAFPALHQAYVWLFWRLELHASYFTSRFGLNKAFTGYAVGFTALLIGRMVVLVLLSISSRDSLLLNPSAAFIATAIIVLPVFYLIYSVARYFTYKRAMGIDHFDKAYRKPFEKRGIFRFTLNGMYLYGFLMFYIPGLLLFSFPGLAVAAFSHISIWVHYYCTERPDMRTIYGETP